MTMNAKEKDAMALATLREYAEDVAADDTQPFLTEHRQQRGKRVHAEYIAAVDHLAERLAELEKATKIHHDKAAEAIVRASHYEERATRAEAELAAVREDAALLAWLSDEFDKNGSISFTQYSVGTAGCELFTITTQRVRGYQLRGAIRAAIKAARGGE